METGRVPLISEPFTPEVAGALSRIMPPGVPPLGLFRALAGNERVFLRVMAGGLLDRGSITLRDRELVIQRTTARLGSEYEWGVHATFFADMAGLGEADLRATLAPSGSGGLDTRTDLLFSLVDELVDTAMVSDSLWERLSLEWTSEQLIELVVLCGFYHLIAFATNALGVPLEVFARRFGDVSPGG